MDTTSPEQRESGNSPVAGTAVLPDSGARAVPGPIAVSVVICSYAEARWPLLEKAVESVLGQLAAGLEVIVVVDHNGALHERAERRWPQLHVVESLGEPGLSAARNTGVRRAAGEIVAFLDDDAVADEAWLERLLAAFRDPVVIAAGGSVEPLWPEKRPWWFPREFDWVVGCTYRGMPLQETDVRNVIGANMAFRRSVLLDVGGFRADLGRVGTFPAGCEETELCLRASARTRPAAIRFVPGACVEHAVSRARTRWSYFLSRCYQEGRSKAIVARLAPSRDSLATEARYVRSTLPRGLGRGVADALIRRDPRGLGRAAAICIGLAATCAGFGLMSAQLAVRARGGTAVEVGP